MTRGTGNTTRGNPDRTGLFVEEAGWVARVLQPRPINPILGMLLLDAREGTLIISGTNNEAASRTVLEATTTTEGKSAVPGRLLAEIAKLMPTKPVTLRQEGTRMIVECGRTSWNLPTYPVDDYPALPESPAPIGTINGEMLSEGVSQVGFAAAKDDTMAALAAMYFRFDESMVTLACTDRYRMAVKRIPWAGTAVAEPVLLRAKSIMDLTRPAPILPVELSLEYGSLFGVASGTRRSTLPTIDGAFPDFERLIPTAGTSTAEIDVAELAEAARRVKIVADRPNIPIRLKFADGEVYLHAGGDADAGASEPVEAKLEGNIIEIAYNPDYLLEALAALQEPMVRFMMNGPSKPTLLQCPADDTYRHILMPVRIGA